MRGRWGRLLIALSAIATGIAAYLAWSKFTGSPPACAIVTGCETVEQSRYSAVLGVPVAAFGIGASVASLAGAFVWWRGRDRRGLLLSYLVGLISLPILGYLTYLELAVIGAVCAWCVSYAITTIAAWGVASVALVQSRGEVPGG
jgi:uncharacterized membrane protein